MAAICGCSPPMICATALASIHFNASMPWPVGGRSILRSSSMSVFCLPTAWVSTRRTKSCVPPAIFALPSAMPMNLSSTELICSRDTSFSSAMAMPNFWTSRASSCLSTLAASCSPRLISNNGGTLGAGELIVSHLAETHSFTTCAARRGSRPTKVRAAAICCSKLGDNLTGFFLRREADADRLIRLARARGPFPCGLVRDFISGRSTKNATTKTSAAPVDLLGELYQPRLLYSGTPSTGGIAALPLNA